MNHIKLIHESLISHRARCELVVSDNAEVNLRNDIVAFNNFIDANSLNCFGKTTKTIQISGTLDGSGSMSNTLCFKLF